MLGGCPEDGKVALVAAVAKGHVPAAPELVTDAARLVGGGGGGRNPELAMAGGRDASRSTRRSPAHGPSLACRRPRSLGRVLSGGSVPRAASRRRRDVTRAGAESGRVLGVDLGSRRIGVAISDDERLVASALAVLPAGSLPRRGPCAPVWPGLGGGGEPRRGRLAAVAFRWRRSCCPGCGRGLAELEVALPVPVECCDERYSTVIAQPRSAAGGARAKRRRQAGARWSDKVAAAAILQTWLDRESAARGGAGPTVQLR